MYRFALLCGSAPENFRQKKLIAIHDFLVSEAGGLWKEDEITIFPNGIHELFLESALNNALEASVADEDTVDKAGQVLLYLCTRNEADVSAELSDCAVPGVEVVRLGEDEVRKDVIAYYADLAEKMGVDFRVEYDWDGDFVGEEALGWERMLTEKAGECLN